MLTRSGISEAIVVVDVDPASLRLCSSTLRRAGYHVLTASSEKQALDFFQPNRTPVGLALIDITNGIGLIAASQRGNPPKRIILMSGYAPEDMKILVETAAADYRCIWKPLEADTLLRLVRNVLRAPAPIHKEHLDLPLYEHQMVAHA